MLREQVVCCQISVLPFLGGLLLSFYHLRWIFYGGAGHIAFEVGPAVGGLHGLSKPHDEDGPVRAIYFKVGNNR